MTEHAQPTPESAEHRRAREALAAYAALDPSIGTFELDTDQLEAWVAACREAPLGNGRDGYMVAGMLHEAALRRLANEDGAASAELRAEAHDRYQQIADSPTNDRLLQAKALAADASIPLYGTCTAGLMMPWYGHEAYQELVGAAAATLFDNPSEEELQYLDSLSAIMLLTEWGETPAADDDKSLLVEAYKTYLPALPRFAEHPEGWQMLFYNRHDGSLHGVRIAEEPDGRTITLFPRELGRRHDTTRLVTRQINELLSVVRDDKKLERTRYMRGTHFGQDKLFTAMTHNLEKIITAQIGNPRQPEVIPEYVTPFEPEVEWWLELGQQFKLPNAVGEDMAWWIRTLEAKLAAGELDSLNARSLAWMHVEYGVITGSAETVRAAEPAFMSAMEQAQQAGDLLQMYQVATEWFSSPLYEAAARGEDEITGAITQKYCKAVAMAAQELLASLNRFAAGSPEQEELNRQLQLMTVNLLLTESGVVIALPSSPRLARRHDRQPPSADIAVWELTVARRTEAFKYRTERGLRLEPTDIKRGADHVAVVAPVILKQHKPGHDFAILRSLIDEVIKGEPRDLRAEGIRRFLENRLWPERNTRVKKPRKK